MASVLRAAPPNDSTLPHSRFRLASIDALRGIAALLVAGYHVWGHYGIYPFPSLGVVPWTHDAGILAYVVSPLRWGYLGVGLFLVLSGFCIHLPFARRRDESGGYDFNWQKFYLRRLWRLYPAYGASVIGTFILLLLAAHGTRFIDAVPSVGDLFTHLTLTHGYFDRYFYGIVDVYWSLALEFQLYLAYPIFLYLFRKAGLTRSIALLTIVSLAWRFVAMNVFHSQLISVAWTGPYAMMGCIFARMPEWLFGAWLAEWFVSGASHRAARLPLAVVSVGILLLTIASTLIQALWLFTDALFGLGFAFMIAAAIASPQKEIVRSPSRVYRWFVWIGTISYSLYLFHMQFSWFANPWIRDIASPTLQFILRIAVLAISIPIVAFIFRFVEAPFLSAPRNGTKLFIIYRRMGRALGIKSDITPVIQLESVQA